MLVLHPISKYFISFKLYKVSNILYSRANSLPVIIAAAPPGKEATPFSLSSPGLLFHLVES
jgi:hypothetical protein